MAIWVRFADGDEEGFGTLSGETIAVHTGDMFDAPKLTGAEKSLGAVRLLMPCSPSKMILPVEQFPRPRRQARRCRTG
jgi:Rv2993c-like, N-terminal